MRTWRLLGPRERVLLIAVLVTGVTTFMFVPLLALAVVADGRSAATAGVVVATLSLSGQGFSLVSGLVVDRLGTTPVTATGLVLRVVGYAMLDLGRQQSLALLLGSVAAIGVGGSMLTLSIKTELLRNHAHRRAMLGLRSTFVNVGVLLGPALGGALYVIGLGPILLCCVLSHALVGASLFLVGRRRDAALVEEGESPDLLAPRPPGRRWASLLAAGALYWFLYSQLNVFVPLVARTTTGSAAAVAVVFTVNGVLVICSQYVLLQHVFARRSTRATMAVGFAAFAVAYLVLMPRLGWVSLLLFVVPVTLGEMLVSPMLDEEAVSLTRARTGTALGVVSLVGALGGALGSTAGGLLVSVSPVASSLALVTLAALGVAVAACGATTDRSEARCA